MRSQKRRDYEHGRVVEVTIVTYGSELSADTASGATELVVEDAVDFDEDGGTLLINEQVIEYTSCDDDTGTLTLATALAADADEGDRVDLYDPLYESVTTTKVAQVKVDGDDDDADPLEATLAYHLIDRIEEGIRGVTGESVILEQDGDEWRVVDLLGRGDPDAPGGTGGGGATKFWQDEFTLGADGEQNVTLAHLPVTNSEHLYWNGVYQREAFTWTRSAQVVTLLDTDTYPPRIGDEVIVEYAYLDGTTSTNPPVPPDPPIEEAVVNVDPEDVMAVSLRLGPPPKNGAIIGTNPNTLGDESTASLARLETAVGAPGLHYSADGTSVDFEITGSLFTPSGDPGTTVYAYALVIAGARTPSLLIQGAGVTLLTDDAPPGEERAAPSPPTGYEGYDVIPLYGEDSNVLYVMTHCRNGSGTAVWGISGQMTYDRPFSGYDIYTHEIMELRILFQEVAVDE